MRNIRMIVAYDGAAYHGWQKQPQHISVQSVLEQAVRRVVRHQVVMIGAGRTDAGVHARGQVANFYTTRDIPVRNMFNAIGARLPKDVTLEHMTDVPLNFHSTRSAVRKLYRYRVFAASCRPVGHHVHRYTYHFWHPLYIDRLRGAAEAIIGMHDFSAFASKGNVRTNNVREVCRCDISRACDEIRFDFIGTGFLYNQVRNMVGTLLEIGRGHWPVERMAEIVASRDRSNAGPTAPARGLSLQWVEYDLPSMAAAERSIVDLITPDPDANEPVAPSNLDMEEEPSA